MKNIKHLSHYILLSLLVTEPCFATPPFLLSFFFGGDTMGLNSISSHSENTAEQESDAPSDQILEHRSSSSVSELSEGYVTPDDYEFDDEDEEFYDACSGDEILPNFSNIAPQEGSSSSHGASSSSSAAATSSEMEAAYPGEEQVAVDLTEQEGFLRSLNGYLTSATNVLITNPENSQDLNGILQNLDNYLGRIYLHLPEQSYPRPFRELIDGVVTRIQEFAESEEHIFNIRSITQQTSSSSSKKKQKVATQPVYHGNPRTQSWHEKLQKTLTMLSEALQKKGAIKKNKGKSRATQEDKTQIENAQSQFGEVTVRYSRAAEKDRVLLPEHILSNLEGFVSELQTDGLSALERGGRQSEILHYSGKARVCSMRLNGAYRVLYVIHKGNDGKIIFEITGITNHKYKKYQ